MFALSSTVALPTFNLLSAMGCKPKKRATVCPDGKPNDLPLFKFLSASDFTSIAIESGSCANGFTIEVSIF